MTPATVSYFTDAAALRGPLSAGDEPLPIVILGPGQPEMAHQTDEYCEVARITEATALFVELIDDWCGALA